MSSASVDTESSSGFQMAGQRRPSVDATGTWKRRGSGWSLRSSSAMRLVLDVMEGRAWRLLSGSEVRPI